MFWTSVSETRSAYEAQTCVLQTNVVGNSSTRQSVGIVRSSAAPTAFVRERAT